MTTRTQDPTEEQEQEDLFEFGGEQLTREEIERRLKWDAENTRRAEENKRNFEAVQAERQRLDEERRQLQGEREKTMSLLERSLPKQPEKPKEPEFPKFSMRDRVAPILEDLKTLDPVTDKDWSQRLARAQETLLANIEQAQGENNQQLLQFYQRKLNENQQQMQQMMDQKLAEQDQKHQVRLSQRDAAGEAQARNERVINEVLNRDDFKALNLDAQQRSEIMASLESHLGAPYGQYDEPSRRWLWNNKAVEDAAWSVPSVRQKIIAGQLAQARREGLEARLKGEQASNSTPRRGRSLEGPAGSSYEERVNYLLGLGRKMTSEAVQSVLSPEEQQRFLRERRQEMAE